MRAGDEGDGRLRGDGIALVGFVSALPSLWKEYVALLLLPVEIPEFPSLLHAYTPQRMDVPIALLEGCLEKPLRSWMAAGGRGCGWDDAGPGCVRGCVCLAVGCAGVCSPVPAGKGKHAAQVGACLGCLVFAGCLQGCVQQGHFLNERGQYVWVEE